MRLSDAELHRQVLAALETEPSLQEEEIGIAVKDGVVTLAGWVETYDHKFAAERAAALVGGVEAVAEQLHVRSPDPPCERTDTQLAHAVTNHLKWHANVPTERIKVKVEHGWATLAGELESYEQKASADAGVRELNGVKGVINLIRVRPTESVERIQAKIEAALLRRAQLEASRINVESEHGRVVLTGSVSSRALSNEVVRAVLSAPGVNEVVDRLKVVVT